MSSKGYSTRTARDLIDMIADTSRDEPVTVFCIHDADASGTMIAQTLQEATKARGRRRIEIVDIGLQPWDADELGLPVENVSYKKQQPVAEYVRSRHDGAFWDGWLQHHRVELNAMTPGELIRWLDDNVERHGALKVVPPPDVVSDKLGCLVEAKIKREETDRVLREAEEAISKAVRERFAKLAERIPRGDDMAGSIREQVTERRDQHWTDIVEQVADDLLTGQP